jgi:glycosyltransferase involved in cell wall biosynthesis
MARYSLQLVRALAGRDDIEVVPIATKVVLDTLADLELRDQLVLPDGQLPETITLWTSVGRRLRDRIDVFHGTRHLVPARSPVPTVLTVQDVLPLDDPVAHDRPKRWLLPPFYRGSIRHASALIAASQATLDRMLAHVPEVASRSEVIPLAMAPDVLQATAQALPDLAGPFALYVGDLSPRKNVDFLLDLWPTVWAAHEVPLLLAGGDGWRSTAVRERIAAGVPGVRRLGFVSDGELRWLYERAAVVVNASTYEGTGLPIVEAMALGAPLVTNDEPALVETAAGRATHIPVADVAGWEHALGDALEHPRRVAPFMADSGAWIEQTIDVYRRCTSL